MRKLARIEISIAKIREDPNIDRILRDVAQLYVRRDIRFMFSFEGAYVFNYHFKAQPYSCAFIVHVKKIIQQPRQGNKPLTITFTVLDLINKAWRNNVRLPKRMKRVLDIIYDEFVEPNEDTFRRALEGSYPTPIEFQEFSVPLKVIRSSGYQVLYCFDLKTSIKESFCRQKCGRYRNISTKNGTLWCEIPRFNSKERSITKVIIINNTPNINST